MRKLTQDEFIQRANLEHNNIYLYTKTIYIDSRAKIIIVCKEHGEFSQTPNMHLSGQGCPKCGGRKNTDPPISNFSDFVIKSNNIHNFKYNYDLVMYSGTRHKVEILCPAHGSFWQTPSNHMAGSGCPHCGQSFPYTTDTFIEAAQKIHGDIYLYSSVIYKNKRTEIDIFCKEHGLFSQLPSNHLAGRGCHICGGQQQYTTKTFIEKSNIIHNNKYIYDLVVYINNDCYLTIICKLHGPFSQRANSHLSGNGCPKCSDTISKPERLWLQSLNIPHEYHHKSLLVNGKRFSVDAFDPTINTVYEFYGDYWHGNPQIFGAHEINKRNKRSFGELYDQTIKRQKLLEDAGFRVICIWEKDWKEANNV